MLQRREVAFSYVVRAALLGLVSISLSGCGFGTIANGPVDRTFALSGTVHGGQQPISGAVIQLYAAAGTGYGTASTPLLTPAATTDAGGNFNITGGYTCPSPGTPVYLTATQGNPGMTAGTNNSGIGLMAALGPCGNLAASTRILINEVTTVAAVWALAPFMADYAHVGTSASNIAGGVNAFSTAAVLANSSTGLTPGTVPDGGTVPAVEINTLANVLAACVNSDGSVAAGTPCGNLYTAATPAGGTAPTNTMAAALNIAQYPGNNVSAVYALVNATGPFQPTLASAPNDWTIAVTYTYGTVAANDMAVDASGNVWIVTGSKLYSMNTGGFVTGTYGTMGGQRVAVDPSGNVWVGDGSTAGYMNLKKLPSNLGAPSTYTHAGVDYYGINYNFTGLAVDGFGNLWYTCDYCYGISESNAAGAYVGSFSITGGFHATNLSVDPSENIWVGQLDSGKVNVFTQGGGVYGSSPYNTGVGGEPQFITNDGSGNAWFTASWGITKMAPTGTYSTVAPYSGYPPNAPSNGGVYQPSAIAMDGAGNAWVSNTVGVSNASGSVAGLSNSLTPITPSAGYVSIQLARPQGIAVDGSGNVWLRNSSSPTVTVFVGAAVPVVTPMSLGLKNGTLGSRP